MRSIVVSFVKTDQPVRIRMLPRWRKEPKDALIEPTVSAVSRQNLIRCAFGIVLFKPCFRNVHIRKQLQMIDVADLFGQPSLEPFAVT